MNNKNWPSEYFGADESDFYVVDMLPNGYKVAVRVRRYERGLIGNALVQVFRQDGTTISEHLLDVSEHNDDISAEIGFKLGRFHAGCE